MPDIADLVPSTDFAPPASSPSSAPVPPPGLWQIGKDAASSEWVSSWAIRQFDRAAYTYDPYFSLDADKVKSLGDGLPVEYWSRFGEAQSDTEAQAIRRQLLDVYGARQRLGQAGWTGRAAQIGASIIDPAAIAVTLGTAGLGGEVAYGGKAARLGMLLRSGLAVGGVNAGLEGYRATQDPEVGTAQVLGAGLGGFGFGVGSAATRGLGRGARVLGAGLGQSIPTMAVDTIDALTDDQKTARDVVYAGAFSFAMGGILNGLHRTDPGERDAAIRARKAIELEDVKTSGATVTPKGEAYFRDVSPDAEAQTVARLTDKTEAAPGAVVSPLPAEATARPLTELERIDAEVSATLKGQQPKVRAEAFAREIITSGWFDPATQKATLREELVNRFGVGAGVADRMITRISPEAPPTPTAAGEKLRQPALSLAEHAELDRRLAEVPTAPADDTGMRIGGNKLGQGVRPAIADQIAADAAPVFGERLQIPTGAVPESLRPSTPGEKLHLPAMLNAEEAAARRYDYSELGGQSVTFSDAFALAKALNEATPGRDYAVVETGDGFTVASRKVSEPVAPKGRPRDVATYVPPEPMKMPKLVRATPAEIALRSEMLRTAVPTMDRADAVDIAGREIARERAQQVVEQLHPAPRDPDSPGPQFAIGAASQSAMEAGLYEQATQRGEKLPGDLNLSNTTDAGAYNPSVVGVNVRQSIAGLNGVSESGAVRRLTAMLVEDPTAKADNSPSRQSASEWGRLKFETDVNRFLRSHFDDFVDWANRNGKPVSMLRPFARAKAFAEFSEMVGRAVRREEGAFSDDPAVNRAANNVRDGLDKLWMLQNRYQVPGFDQVTPAHNYLTRIWNLTKLNALTERFGAATIEKLVAQAIENRTPNVGTERATIFAKGMLRTIREAKMGSELDRGRILELPDVEVLRKAIRDAVPGISDATVNDVLYHVAPGEGDNLPPRARRRVILDETASINAIDQRTGQPAQLSIEDLLENNAAKVYARYSRDAYGRSAVAEVIRASRTSDTDPLDSVQALLDRTSRQAMSDYGVTNRDAAKSVDAQIARLEVAFKSVLGHRLGGDSRLAEGARLLRAFNYMAVGGRVGLHHAQDLASAVGEAGFGTVLRSIPSLARLIASAVSGEMKDETIREVEALWAAGTDHFRGSIGHYLDHDSRVHFMGETADEMIRAGARTMNVVNFLAPVASFNQRAAAIFAEQKWLDIARARKSMSVGRLADMGLTVREADDISEQMRQHATTQAGLFGRKIVAANVNLWDADTAARYIGAVDRWSRSAVVRGDIGQQAKWMTSDAGQILSQFRNFTIAAHEKNLVRNGRRMDATTFNNWAMTTLAGAMAYTVNEYVNSLGRKDADKYRREKLDTKEIAKAAFQRSSWSAFLPTAIDTVATDIGYDPLFAGGRFSGLSTNLVTGNPSYSTLDSLYHAPHALTAPMHRDYRFSQTDFRVLRNLIPYQNAFGIKNLLDRFAEDLPRRSKNN